MNCPFCKSELNPGATVCAHCGATEQMVPDPKQIWLKVGLPALGLLIVIGFVVGYLSNFGVLALGLLGWWGWRRYQRVPRKAVWVRRVG